MANWRHTFLTVQLLLSSAGCSVLLVVYSFNVDNANSPCWTVYNGVCVKTGTDGCPFRNGWFSWLHCPVGYHCCSPPKPSGPQLNRHHLTQCGTRAQPDPSPPVAMVIGGSTSAPGRWPWMVRIRRKRAGADQGEQHCGGVLVHPDWVMTAGHCFAWADPGDSFTLHLGHVTSAAANQRRDTAQQEFNASRILVHEEFFKPLYSNDIALVRLNRRAELGHLVQPICLPEIGESFDDTVGCVAGWGATSDSDTSNRLMETQLPLVGTAECKVLYNGTNRPVYTENLCAGFLAGERDACHGDSGGPLMVHRDGLWLAAGLVSHGEGCGVPRRPGVYTGVSNYVQWVRHRVACE